jgi:hypothetical protein
LNPTGSPGPVSRLDEVLTVEEVAKLWHSKPTSIYNLTRTRGTLYAHQLPVMRLPFGLRFSRRCCQPLTVHSPRAIEQE